MISINTNNNWLNEQAEKNRKYIFLEDDLTSLTFFEVKNRVNFLVDYFIKNGIHEGLKVALVLSNSIDFITTVIASWQIGATPVPINLLWPVEQINEILESCKFEKIIADENFGELKKRPYNEFISLKNVIGSVDESKEIKFNLHSEALMLFTSGSTGKPKGVLFSFNNLLQSALNVDEFVKHTYEDRWLASLPFYHIGGFSIITRSLLSGCSIFVPPSQTTSDIVKSLREKDITLASLVGTQLKKIIDNKIASPESLKYLFIGGGPVNDEFIKQAITLKYPLVKVYGSTETASMVTAVSISEEPEKINSSGKRLGDVSIKITGESNSEVKIKSGCVADFYFDNNETIPLKEEEGFYNSGDIGYIENDYLYITDRAKRIIISGGENISAAEIENILLEHPGVKDVFVKPIPDAKWGEVPLAVIAFEIHSQAGLSDIIEFVEQKLPTYKQPKRYLILDDIPRNDLGKINNYELDELLKRS
jgi:o-succinylbenzoate---CoA ligase